MSRYQLEYKCSIWNRISFNSKQSLDEAIALIESGMNPNELGYEDDNMIEPILEVEEFITPEENDGHATIECYDCDRHVRRLIWNNSYESQVKRKQYENRND